MANLAATSFDTRQFNHIVWEPGALAAFRKALTARIQNTVGRGPVPVVPLFGSLDDKTS